MWILRFLLILLIVILLVGFAIYNAGQKVTVQIFKTSYQEVPMIFVAYWSFVIGMMVAVVLGLTYYLKIHRRLSEHKRENKKLTSELAALRNVAIEEESEEKL